MTCCSLTNHVMKSSRKSPHSVAIIFYVFVLNYSTVSCCFLYFTLLCLNLNTTDGVGGLHHTCELTWLLWRLEKRSVVPLSLSVVFQRTLGAEWELIGACRLWIMYAEWGDVGSGGLWMFEHTMGLLFLFMWNCHRSKCESLRTTWDQSFKTKRSENSRFVCIKSL